MYFHFKKKGVYFQSFVAHRILARIGAAGDSLGFQGAHAWDMEAVAAAEDLFLGSQFICGNPSYDGGPLYRRERMEVALESLSAAISSPRC